jgi:hypothetical protein
MESKPISKLKTWVAISENQGSSLKWYKCNQIYL